jgi:hypothetical protein
MKVEMVKAFGIKDSVTGNITNYSVMITCDDATNVTESLDQQVKHAKKVLAEFNLNSIRESSKEE